MKKILDSGNRTEFKSGAVRDIQEGKGRCDLMPLDVVSTLLQYPELKAIQDYKRTGNARFLFTSLDLFCAKHYEGNSGTMMLEVAKHFEEGAEKYGENNWQKGLPVHSFINSAIRHLLKHKSGWDDEPHDRAFVWNIICAIWTIWHKPELNDFTVIKDGVE
jgi:hypothetical protein